jgi:hypothetical protein
MTDRFTTWNEVTGTVTAARPTAPEIRPRPDPTMPMRSRQ